MLPPALEKIRARLRDKALRTSVEDQVYEELQALDGHLHHTSPGVERLIEKLRKRAIGEVSGPMPGRCPCCDR